MSEKPVRRIAIIQGHPDPAGKHLCHALADAYADGAARAGHAVDRIEIAALDFPWLKTREDFEKGALPPGLESAAAAIKAADHLLIVYPLWLGTMPALVKAFLEQVFRPGIAFKYENKWGKKRKLFSGKSARVVVTMGMPGLLYRWYFGAHGLKSLERSILAFCGIGPITDTLFGLTDNVGETKRRKWLASMYEAGQAGN